MLPEQTDLGRSVDRAVRFPVFILKKGQYCTQKNSDIKVRIVTMHELFHITLVSNFLEIVYFIYI